MIAPAKRLLRFGKVPSLLLTTLILLTSTRKKTTLRSEKVIDKDDVVKLRFGICVQASGPLPHGAPTDLAVRISALQQGPQPLVDLFNQYAAPYHQWELCLYLVHASDGVDMSYVQQLWDLYLKQVSFQPSHFVLLGSGCNLDATAALPSSA